MKTKETELLPRELLQQIFFTPAPTYAEIQRYGICLKCGQLVTLPQSHVYDDYTANAVATQNCDCEEATKQRYIDKAQRDLEELFGAKAELLFNYEEVDDRIIKSMHKLAKMVGAGLIDKASIDIPGDAVQIKAKISLDSKGRIKIDRADTKKMGRTS